MRYFLKGNDYNKPNYLYMHPQREKHPFLGGCFYAVKRDISRTTILNECVVSLYSYSVKNLGDYVIS
jgi:hypothetical protein